MLKCFGGARVPTCNVHNQAFPRKYRSANASFHPDVNTRKDIRTHTHTQIHRHTHTHARAFYAYTLFQNAIVWLITAWPNCGSNPQTHMVWSRTTFPNAHPHPNIRRCDAPPYATWGQSTSSSNYKMTNTRRAHTRIYMQLLAIPNR